MAIYSVSYDLRQQGRNYEGLYKYLRKFNHCHNLESSWLIETDWSTKKVRDDIMDIVDGNDVIFVVKLVKDWHSLNIPCGDWLNDAARKW